MTKREVEIIPLVCKAFSSKEIANQLFLSSFTVQTHRRNIIKKLGLDDSKISLYKFAIDNGIFSKPRVVYEPSRSLRKRY